MDLEDVRDALPYCAWQGGRARLDYHKTNAQTWNGVDGWGYSKFLAAHNRSITILIQDVRKAGGSTGLPFESTHSAIKINVPDDRFQASIDAQVANIMTSAVQNETRPGEPINYPLPWLRDGAYELVALARAGRLDSAEFMGEYFAEHDFFGGVLDPRQILRGFHFGP